MELSKNLKLLTQEAEDLGLMGAVVPTGRAGKVLKKDIGRVLSLYHLYDKYGGPDGVPKNVKYRMSFESPQLASPIHTLKKDQQERIWNDPKIRLVEKIAGVRATLVYTPAEGVTLFSREVSEEDCLYTDYTRRVLPDVVSSDDGVPFVLDVEIELDKDVKEQLRDLGQEVDNDVHAMTALFQLDDNVYDSVKVTHGDLFRLKILDVYYYAGDYTSKPYSVRMANVTVPLQTVISWGVKAALPDWCNDPNLKKAFHEGIMKDGGEGTVAVHEDQACNLNTSRKKDGWIKVKTSIFPEMFDKSILTDTVDCWVSAVEMDPMYGFVHSLSLSTHVNKEEVAVGVVDMIPLSMRRGIEWKEGMVVEINALKLSAENKLVRPLVESVRWDRNSFDCVLVV